MKTNEPSRLMTDSLVISYPFEGKNVASRNAPMSVPGDWLCGVSVGYCGECVMMAGEKR